MSIKKIAFILNGTRKPNSLFESIIQLCQESPELRIFTFQTQGKKDATRIAKECADNDFYAIIAVGGDGTVNEVSNGLMQSLNPLPILAVIPNGTGNDFVRGTDLILDPKAFVRAIQFEEVTLIDVVKINSILGEMFYVNIADIGFGGRVVELLDRQRKLIGGKASYAMAILRAFIGYKKPILEIHTPEFQFKGAVLMAAICNGSIFGDGLVINPYAKMNDGLLNLTILGKVTLIDYARNLSNLKHGIPINHKEAIYLSAKQVTIRIIQGRASTEMDGEYIGDVDLHLEIVPSALKLLKY